MENNTLARYRDKLKSRIKWASAYNLFVVLIIFLNRTLGNRFATVIAIYLSQTVFFTLLGALAFTVLIKGGLKLYFRRAL